MNTSAETYTSFDISYLGEIWRWGGVTGTNPNKLTFSFAIDAPSIAAGTFTTISALNFNSPVNSGTPGALNGNLPANQLSIASTVTDFLWAPGSTLTIRWMDLNDPGSDDGSAIDNLLFIARAEAFRDLVWSPEPSSILWNSVNPNWDNNAASTVFQNGDAVRFTDIGVGNVTIDAGGVTPLQLIVENTIGLYQFAGGAIAGAGQIIKSGSGRLVIENTISSSGGVILNGGILETIGDSRLAGNTALTINGGSVILGGSETISTLVMGSGGILETNPSAGSSVTSGIQVSSGTIQSEINGALSISAGPVALSVARGSCDLDLLLNASLDGSGRITVSGGGIVDVAGLNLGFGGGFTLSTNTTLIISDQNSLGTNQFFFNGGTLISKNELTGSNRIQNIVSIGGDVTIDGTNPIEFADMRTFFGSLTKVQTIIGTVLVSGPIGFANLINKGGAGTMILSAANSYSGNTTVQAGVLKLTGDGSITGSPVIRVDSGATFDLSELQSYAFLRTSELTQRIAGSGTILNPIDGLEIQGVVAPGSALGGGGEPTAALQFVGNLSLTETAAIEIQIVGNGVSLFDRIAISDGALLLNGDLIISLLGAFTPAEFDQFQIVTATSITGFFSNVAFGTRLEFTEGSFLVYSDGSTILLTEFVPIPEPQVIVIFALCFVAYLAKFGIKQFRSQS